MPTVILLDVSLSMTRPVPITSQAQDAGAGENVYTRLQLACHGINTLLEYFSVNYKLEFVSLVVFSSMFEVLCPFTRNFDSIRKELTHLEEHDKTCVERVLHGVNRLVLDEWGSSTPCHVILITDCCPGIGPMSLEDFLNRTGSQGMPLPFSFPGKLIVLCIAGPNDAQLSTSLSQYRRLVDLAGDGTVHVPEGGLSLSSVQAMVQSLAEVEFTPYQGTLTCGHLSSKITMCPAPLPYTKVSDFDTQTHTVSDVIEVCGFVDMADVGSPAAVSRHLILPLSVPGAAPAAQPPPQPTTATQTPEESDDENTDEGRVPSFCVLLHGALKVENMAALCLLAKNWFGVLYSWADNKKKSNLMLTVLEPGSDAVPWLGDLTQLGSIEDSINLQNEDGSSPPAFPVRPAGKRSYSVNCVVWIRQSGLHSDIQKILRHARKLPDKTQNFYKELNRVRRAAINFGFIELLDGLATILERECTLLPGSAHPDCALQMTHAAGILRKPIAREPKYVIPAMHTKFAGDE